MIGIRSNLFSQGKYFLICHKKYFNLFGFRGILLFFERICRKILPQSSYKLIFHFNHFLNDKKNDYNFSIIKDFIVKRESLKNNKYYLQFWCNQKIIAGDIICDHVFNFLGTN